MTSKDLSTAAPTPTSAPRMGPRMGAGGSTVKARDFGGVTRRLAGMIAKDRLQLTLILICTLGSTVLGTSVPWLLGRATDSITSPLDSAGLLRQILIVTAVQVLAVLLNAAQAWATNALVQSFGRDLRAKAEAKLSRLPLAWFDRQPRGEVLSRITNDIDNVTQSLQQLLGQLLISILQLLGVLAMMLLLSPVLALAALISITLSTLVARLITRASQPHFAQQWRLTGTITGVVEEAFAGQTLMRVFGHQSSTRTTFEAGNQALRVSAGRAQVLSGLLQPVMMFVGNLGFIAVVIGGALSVLAGSMTIGALQSFVQYIRQLNQPIGQIASAASVLQSAAASAERVFELLDAPEMSPDPAGPQDVTEVKGHVAFDHVTFRYDPARPLFEDVSLQASPGQTIAIVGPTGAGKTTLVNLLMRFYEVDGGTIRLDGIDTTTFTRAGLRQHFGMVLQDAWLFTGTIRDNILYGKDGATEAQMLEAARACHVDDFVQTLAQGYDTILTENGAGVSTGQRQLVTLARAFIARPMVLILDEATSSVDTRTELLVQRAMAHLRQGRTSFVIAHRLSTIRDADSVVYMEHGTVLEQGSPADLMALRGHYWRLHQSQFAIPPTA